MGGGSRRVPIRKSLPEESRLRFERLEDRTLLTADLIAFRPVTEFIDYSKFPVSEVVEEDAKTGPGIRVNGDDDNANGQRDYLDKGPSATADNDLVRVDAKGSGRNLHPIVAYDPGRMDDAHEAGRPLVQRRVPPSSQTNRCGLNMSIRRYIRTSAKMTLTVSERRRHYDRQRRVP